ncbi:hypothetical protein D3C72_1756660 [compost metagenome]
MPDTGANPCVGAPFALVDAFGFPVLGDAHAEPADQRIHVLETNVGADVVAAVQIDVAVDGLQLRFDVPVFVELVGVAVFQRGGVAPTAGFQLGQVVGLGLDVEAVDLQHAVQIPAGRAEVRPVRAHAIGAQGVFTGGTAGVVADACVDGAGR